MNTTQKKVRQSQIKDKWAFLSSNLDSYRWHILGFFLVAIFWAVDVSLRPYLLKLILDRVAISHPSYIVYQLMYPALIYIGLSFLFNLNFRFYSLIRFKMMPNLKQDIIKKLAQELLAKNHYFYQDNFTGAVSAKIENIANGFCELISLFIDKFISQFLAVIFACVTMYFVHPFFCIITSGWMMLYLLVSVFCSKHIYYLSGNLSEANNNSTGNIVDMFSGMLIIRLFCSRDHEEKRVSALGLKSMEAEKRLSWFMLKLNLFQGLSFLIIQILCLTFLMYGRKYNHISIGDFALILTINLQIIDSLWSLSADISRFSSEFGKVFQGLNLISLSGDQKSDKEKSTLRVVHGEIDFRNIYFKHQNAKYLYSNQSVKIKGGQKVGLVGYSGGGKTTFINLLLRIFQPQYGQILIDNQDIAGVTEESLCQAISVVPQNPLLFHRTIYENITYGNFDATMEEVAMAAKKIHIHDFIDSLPEGYSTIVGEGGVKLSAGQRQRIVIARAVLKNSPIFLLDEATSSLDSITERLIQQSLISLMENKTTIVIAHRLSTLMNMDRILVIDHGEIVEDGHHDELLQAHGLYKSLWDTQNVRLTPNVKKIYQKPTLCKAE